MAFKVLRELASFLHATPFYMVMMDETSDMSNCEQVTVFLRWISEDFEVNEEFMGLYSIKAKILFSAIKDVLLRFNLALSNIRGQCYDATAAMAGCKSGVVTRLLQEQPGYNSQLLVSMPCTVTAMHMLYISPVEIRESKLRY